LFCVMVHSFGPNSAALGPKLDPTVWGEPLRWHKLFGHSFREFPKHRAVTGHHESETLALTGSAKEHKALKTRSREFLLFPDCSCVGSENQIGGRIGPGAN
jgi:hypothetical protein